MFVAPVSVHGGFLVPCPLGRGSLILWGPLRACFLRERCLCRPDTLVPHLVVKSHPGTAFPCSWWRGANRLWAGAESHLALRAGASRGGRAGPVWRRTPPQACCLRDIPQVNPDTGYINYDQLEENARLFHPKLIIAGDEPGGKEPSLSAAPGP